MWGHQMHDNTHLHVGLNFVSYVEASDAW